MLVLLNIEVSENKMHKQILVVNHLALVSMIYIQTKGLCYINILTQSKKLTELNICA